MKEWGRTGTYGDVRAMSSMCSIRLEANAPMEYSNVDYENGRLLFIGKRKTKTHRQKRSSKMMSIFEQFLSKKCSILSFNPTPLKVTLKLVLWGWSLFLHLFDLD